MFIPSYTFNSFATKVHPKCLFHHTGLLGTQEYLSKQFILKYKICCKKSKQFNHMKIEVQESVYHSVQFHPFLYNVNIVFSSLCKYIFHLFHQIRRYS